MSFICDNLSMVKELRIYTTSSGKQPFLEWLRNLKDAKVRSRIRTRLDRLVVGHYGDYKHISSGIYELILAFGSGYRIYFGEISQSIVLLLCGGNKRTQHRDIEKAQKYWLHAREGVDYE